MGLAPKVADDVYKANLMVSAPLVRLCCSVTISVLNELQIALVMAIAHLL